MSGETEQIAIINQQLAKSRWRSRQLPLLLRRSIALVLEVSLLAASAAIPYQIGAYWQNSRRDASDKELVPLNPAVAAADSAIAQTLALPQRPSNPQVPPLTNLFWCAALIIPVAVTGWQLYLLSSRGQTSPKRWLGIIVLNASGKPPGIGRALWREGAGRWGICLSLAYLVWRYSGAFPDLGILFSLAGLALTGAGAIALRYSQQRTLWDAIAGTWVQNSWQPAICQPARWDRQQVTLELQNGSNGQASAITTIVLSVPRQPRFHLWQWMRRHPGLTLLIVSAASMTAILGTFAGTQIYIQSQANSRELNQQNNQVFVSLVKQLSNTPADAMIQRRELIFAVARLDDARVLPFLADLLSQETRPELLAALQQALASNGLPALPYLQRLNQALHNDQEAWQRRNASLPTRQQVAWQQRATQRAIAKILNVYSGQIGNADLSRTYLDSSSNLAPFALVLDKLDLSGINFRSAMLSQASFKGTRFYGAGVDGRWGTFDDAIADFSGADLQGANLADAILTQTNLIGANLAKVNLTRANLDSARLARANLSSSNLVRASLQQAGLDNASLTGADLGGANFTQANLQNARFTKASAIDAQFNLAMLARSNWQGADLSGANLQRANLQGADFSGAKLVGTNLNQANLQNANLSGANLSTADLQGANLDGADLRGAALVTFQSAKSNQFIQNLPLAATAARLKGVNFTKVKNLDAKQISFICDRGGIHPRCRWRS